MSQSTSSSGNDDDDDDDSPQSNCTDTTLPSVEGKHSAHAIYELIKTIHRAVGTGEEETTNSDLLEDSGQPGAASSITWKSMPRSYDKSIRILEKETRSKDITELRRSIDIFFENLNPHYPCLNEHQFRVQFEAFLANSPTQLHNADRYQFVALINLIQAEVKVLGDDWTTSNEVPAWEEFCRAESILNNIIWLGDGNILTLQCLVIKARYLLYIEKGESAYDTIGRVVRLVFQLGLHDQNSWSQCSAFDKVLRQRIFWTIVYLERNIAFNVGSPYMIREADYNVDLPGNYDDKLMIENQPLPEETPERSSGPYLSSAAKWSQLSAEMWDALFGINAKNADCDEFVVSMDARINLARNNLAPHLKWESNLPRLEGHSNVPSYILRQTLILHLVSNFKFYRFCIS